MVHYLDNDNYDDNDGEDDDDDGSFLFLTIWESFDNISVTWESSEESGYLICTSVYYIYLKIVLPPLVDFVQREGRGQDLIYLCIPNI